MPNSVLSTAKPIFALDARMDLSESESRQRAKVKANPPFANTEPQLDIRGGVVGHSFWQRRLRLRARRGSGREAAAAAFILF